MNGIPESQMSEFARDVTVPIGIENGTIRVIPLSQGLVTIIDMEDYEWLNQWKWHTEKGRHTYYAARTCGGRKVVRTLFKMHREILGLQHGDEREGDHKNRHGLDNRRLNLRIASRSLNRHNSLLYSNNVSGYRGVSWDSQNKKWQADLRINRKYIWLGRFASPYDAALAYDKAAIKYWGPNATLNFPKEEYLI